MANVLHPTPPQILVRHQDNIMASLAHRLEVARATNNDRLLELLEQEKQQLAPDRDLASVTTADKPQTSWFETLKKGFANAVFGGTDLQVCQIVDGNDTWWYASDPQTGQSVYADSEAELRLWIKQNYHGK